MTAAEIEARVVELEAQINPLLKEREVLTEELAELKSPFKKGDTITWGRRGQRGRVLKSFFWLGEVARWNVRSILKDGSEGQVWEVRSYDKPTRT